MSDKTTVDGGQIPAKDLETTKIWRGGGTQAASAEAAGFNEAAVSPAPQGQTPRHVAKTAAMRGRLMTKAAARRIAAIRESRADASNGRKGLKMTREGRRQENAVSFAVGPHAIVVRCSGM